MGGPKGSDTLPLKGLCNPLEVFIFFDISNSGQKNPSSALSQCCKGPTLNFLGTESLNTHMRTNSGLFQGNLSQFKKRLFSVSVCLVSPIVILASFESILSNGPRITVMTDKVDYRPGEPIKIILTNNLGDSIFSHIRSGTPVFCIKHLERNTKGGEWTTLYAQCQAPHCQYDVDAPGEIKTGESEILNWNPLVFVNGTSRSVLPKTGVYRLSISYEDAEKENWKSAYTNEFTIR
jgi:hypothetical protein